MEPAILIVLVVIILVVVIIRQRRRAIQRRTQTDDAGIAPPNRVSGRHMRGSKAAPSLDDPCPVFSVVSVGASGSGKTLLLASMYHELQTPAGRSYFLTAPLDQVIALKEWYVETADTEGNWPAGTSTGEIRNFTFTVQTRMPSGGIRPVMQVDCLEYSGGVLTDAQAPGSTVQAEVDHRIRSAHGLVGIIDGYRLRQLMDGVELGQTRLGEGIDTLISVMLLATCPVTFVITKWDLLRDLGGDENASLRLVKKQLMYFKGFRDLVEQHSFHRVVRLIPVSAVGPDFATLDNSGRITKLRGAEVHPTNIDVPLCAVVPDLFEQVELNVDAAQLHAEFERIRRQARLGPAAAMAELGRFLVLKTGSTLTSLGPKIVGFVGDAALELLRASGDAERESRQADLDRTISVAERDMEEFRAARRRVIREFQRRVDVLEGSLPSSRLVNED